MKQMNKMLSKSVMLKIYADFNHQDEFGRILLNTVGSINDLNKYKILKIITCGMEVILYMEDKFEVKGKLRLIATKEI